MHLGIPGLLLDCGGSILPGADLFSSYLFFSCADDVKKKMFIGWTEGKEERVPRRKQKKREAEEKEESSGAVFC